MVSLRIADAFPVVRSLPPKNSVAIFRKIATLFFGGRERTTGNASAVRRLQCGKDGLKLGLSFVFMISYIERQDGKIFRKVSKAK